MKRNHGQKEIDQIQRIRKENDKLKREISSLRKQLARIDLDRYGHVKSIVEEHLADQENIVSTEDMLESMKNQWKCHECNSGFLEITLYSKMGQTHYFRKCNNCVHRTVSKPYTPAVKGIIKDPSLVDQKDPLRKK